MIVLAQKDKWCKYIRKNMQSLASSHPESVQLLEEISRQTPQKENEFDIEEFV